MSQEDFNETSILNDTELINGTIPSWRTDYEGDWWTILIVSSGITVKIAYLMYLTQLFILKCFLNRCFELKLIAKSLQVILTRIPEDTIKIVHQSPS